MAFIIKNESWPSDYGGYVISAAQNQGVCLCVKYNLFSPLETE